MKPCLVLYMPVIHDGYRQLLRAYEKKVARLYILGASLIHEHKYLVREIRALPPNDVRDILRTTTQFPFIKVLGRRRICALRDTYIITADEQITRRIAKRYFRRSRVRYVKSFLRWDESSVDTKAPTKYDRTSHAKNDRLLMQMARREAEKSSDWWRHVGAIVPLRSKMLVAHNEHVPSEYAQYAYGDIRDFIPAGTKSDVCSAIHAEKNLIAQAARDGISLLGRSLYVTTFPCSDCARVIAYAGIKQCFFGGGHASFDGVGVLKAYGVELIFVK
ncbi:MAG: hypothetical protein A3B25_03175 [Candidatus Ryanbacteria bacterium RIFCSPLOWO2_01_FULL_48_26]|uniref:CMP/dCMP-type deaminase domain-containing protein n=1 Tax=Candidatus Ryanbacteria bacterium RIFCSPLOWO2_01_FULL_48_26 TaxID=1802126 RepID=A0A1G2GRN7_9BACT|nr:MAG: hypothetical protein A3B25_03175 [Candidatus Ryanbacteria bacterium RIFCSPLOWO2_01_FULL_48_26]